MLYVGQTVTSTVRAMRWKAVTCDHCAAEWAFLMDVGAEGYGHNPYLLNAEGAAQAARERAMRTFAKLVEAAVPDAACPRCGYYQRGKVEKLRGLRNGGLGTLGVTALIVAAAIGFTALLLGLVDESLGRAETAGALAAALAAAGVFALVWRRRLARAYDPNDDAATRAGRERAGEPSVMMRDRYEQAAGDARARGEPWPPIEWRQKL